MNGLNALLDLGKHNTNIVVLGNHPGIIQSMIDYDYLTGKEQPLIKAIIGSSRRFERYFWGKQELLIPCYGTIDEALNDSSFIANIHFFYVTESARRVLQNTKKLISSAPNLRGGVIFAEKVPERHSLELSSLAQKKGIFILGPASVGVIAPPYLKLGPIAGTVINQIIHSETMSAGDVAVISTSGGMVNEIIHKVTSTNLRLTWALAIGGERYPIASPVDAIRLALEDARVKMIVYFGELGGDDEYQIADFVRSSKKTKTIIAYIAGASAEKLPTPPQFGHAKALAQTKDESSTAKKKYLRLAGVKVAEDYAQFEAFIDNYALQKNKNTVTSLHSPIDIKELNTLVNRRHALFIDNISTDNGEAVEILGENLTTFAVNNSFTDICAAMFLGKAPKSNDTSSFIGTCLKLLVDHGPQVSGVVNTMIAARAGRDLTAALSSGLLTIGPRFGGAISDSAKNWLYAIQNSLNPKLFVEEYASNKKYIPGIGHKKYRIDKPDPRVELLIKKHSINGEAIKFAQDVEAITSAKKSQLILNVDGAVGAIMIDLLLEREGYSYESIQRLIDAEFFNAIFVLSRSVGLIAHYIEQNRVDENLFRMPDDLIGTYRL